MTIQVKLGITKLKVLWDEAKLKWLQMVNTLKIIFWTMWLPQKIKLPQAKILKTTGSENEIKNKKEEGEYSYLLEEILKCSQGLQQYPKKYWRTNDKKSD